METTEFNAYATGPYTERCFDDRASQYHVWRFEDIKDAETGVQIGLACYCAKCDLEFGFENMQAQPAMLKLQTGPVVEDTERKPDILELRNGNGVVTDRWVDGKHEYLGKVTPSYSQDDELRRENDEIRKEIAELREELEQIRRGTGKSTTQTYTWKGSFM